MTRFLACVSLLFCSVLLAEGAEGAEGAEQKVHFSDQIQPIFVKNCTACHGGVKAAGNISLIYRERVVAKGKSKKTCVVPGSPETSELVRRIKLPQDDDDVMPKADHGHKLSDEEIKLIEQWIREGAEWTGHWSFSPLRPEENGIDDFVRKKLKDQGLTPSAEASKEEILRRVSLDLTGLPPTLQELESFKADTTPNAYEKVVDRLLASSAYGERWASMWLDLARYADSEGLGQDRPREVYPYRDWVIKALNDDLPYDQFTIKQLAGDLLPDFTLDDLVATGFHRMTQMNAEGGTDDEQFRMEAVMDRTSTTWNVWQGITMECVQCHSHPYDPIEHEDYYSTMAFFNNAIDNDTTAYPEVKVPTSAAEKKAYINAFRQWIDGMETRDAFSEGLYQHSKWHDIKVGNYHTNREQMNLQLVQSQEQGQEFQAYGTPTHSHHHISFQPTHGEPITAIRVKVYPKDIKKAAYMGESGFTMALHLGKDAKGKKREAVKLVQVHVERGSEPEDPQELIDTASKVGWGIYSKQFRPVWMVVIPEKPIQLGGEGESIYMMLRMNRTGNAGSVQMVPRRFTIHTSSEQKWIDANNSQTHDQHVAAVKSARQTLDTIKGAKAMVIRQRKQNRYRETRLFERGNWMVRGEVQTPGTPASLPPIKKNPNRLDLAQWIVSKENPLTARVWVNRLWHALFGLGIVETLEDYGAAGTTPTHPRMLDTLAHRFMHKHHWHTKPMLKEIVMSSTYRQTAHAALEKRKLDPQNRWLSYGPRQRLTGEMLRDSALHLSGLYTSKLYGAPTFPPIPSGVWRPFQGPKWETPKIGDPQRYRRALYTFVKREIPFPQNEVFDAPNRFFCTQRRINSNTPIQALMMMNDEVFIECAKKLGTKMDSWKDLGIEDKLKKVYKLVTTTEPGPTEMAQLSKAYHDLVAMQQHAPDPEQAARTMLCSILLNLDEFMTR